ncbi:MAG: Gfo/Idh/MocA family oxidoreductase [Propionibacterium sp.]|nr:Gfo/Idh/MocA family oxidoreductase [Propionibacterium sp.]
MARDGTGGAITGLALCQNRGPDLWHPSIEFFYAAGGGPVLDVGPYYLTNLVLGLGPGTTVTAIGGRARSGRAIPAGPRQGTVVPVEVVTHAEALLTHSSGATSMATFSFDSSRRRRILEFGGVDATVQGSDPNTLGGRITRYAAPVVRGEKIVDTIEVDADGAGRGIGVVDMVRSIASGTPHRATGELALHVLEIMLAINEPSSTAARSPSRAPFHPPSRYPPAGAPRRPRPEARRTTEYAFIITDFHHHFHQQERLTRMSEKKLRVGVIGLGFIARNKHLPGLASVSDRADIVAFCDFEQDLCDKYLDKYGTGDSYTTNDWHEVVNDPTIDVIHVCTWNVSHMEITCAALEAGKHVMCEKPMAITGAEARTMLETAKRTGRKLTIGYQNRFRDDAQFVRQSIDEGALGDIYLAKAHAVRRRGVPTWGVFTDIEKQGGGPLIDIGTHALDLTLWYLDNYEVDQVSGQVFHKIAEIPYGDAGSQFDQQNFSTEDSAFGFIKMKNGATIFLEAAWALNVLRSREASCTLVGTKGGAEMITDNGYVEAVLNGVAGGKTVYTQPGPSVRQYGIGGGAGSDFGILEQASWIDAVINDTEPLVKPEQAVVVTEILEAIYKSAATGETIKF